jgi:FAD/FMN-containing dehydrogenase
MAQTIAPASSTARSPQVSGLDGTPIDLGAQTLAQLTAQLHGRMLRPSDPGFDEAVTVWNGMVSKRPALVVQPLCAADVQTTVRFARERGLLLSVKGGGHHAAGTAIADGGLMLDMARMRQVGIDPTRRLAHVQSGCRLGDVDGATQAQGLATVLGADADTGVAGLTLGGGFGWLTRRFGWAVDNLEEVELVTADGKLRRAAEDENQELFWALRGGGGNFGVVTRFTFRLHEVGPIVTAGMMVWEATAADRVLDAYRQVTEAAPRELSVALTMRLAPHAEKIPAHLRGRPVIGIVACHSGDAGVADRLLAPFRKIPAQLDGITRKAYVDHQFVLGFPQPAGLHTYWKSEFLPRLSDGFLDAYKAASAVPTSPLSQVILVQLGGAIADRPADATAMANRDAEYIMLANGTWPPGDPDGPRHIRWVRSAWEALRPYSVGGNYVNAHNADEDEERTREAYRGGYARLAGVKARYDRDNFFRVNRNISPAS